MVLRIVCLMAGLIGVGLTTTLRAELVKLSDLAGSGTRVGSFEIVEPTGQVVFSADAPDPFESKPEPDLRALFSVVPARGSVPVQLTEAFSDGEIFEWKLSPDGAQVVFVGDVGVNRFKELFLVSSSESGTQMPLDTNPKLPPPNADSYRVDSFAFTPQGDRVVFSGRVLGEPQRFLASVPISGGLAVSLSGFPSAGGDVSTSFQISPDGTRVLFSGTILSAHRELFVASSSQFGTRQKVSSTLVAGNVDQFFFLPNGTQAVYTGDLTSLGMRELYRNSLDPVGTQTRLGSTPVPGGDVEHLLQPLMNQRFLFTGDVLSDGRFDLFANLNNTNSSVLLNTPRVGGNVGTFSPVMTPNGARVLFLGDLTEAGKTDLYSSETAGQGTQVRLSNGSAPAGYEVQGFEITPDGNRVIFWGNLNAQARIGIFSAPVDGSSPQVALFQPGADQIVRNPTLSHDGTSVLFVLVNDTATPSTHLMRVPSDGSIPAEFVEDITGIGSISALGETPDGTPIVAATELYAVLPDIIPPPTPTAAPPVVRVQGKKTIRTKRARVVVRGTASSNAGIARVEFKAGKGGFRPARGTDRWRAVVRLKRKAKRAVASIRAVANDGQSSRIQRVRVVRTR